VALSLAQYVLRFRRSILLGNRRRGRLIFYGRSFPFTVCACFRFVIRVLVRSTLRCRTSALRCIRRGDWLFFRGWSWSSRSTIFPPLLVVSTARAILGLADGTLSLFGSSIWSWCSCSWVVSVGILIPLRSDRWWNRLSSLNYIVELAGEQ
jgi:hypothetical protein